MKTKFNDVKHLYLGCEIRNTGQIWNWQMITVGYMADLSKDCKPILYPLKSMSERQRDDVFPSDAHEPLMEFVDTLKSDMFLYPDQFVKLLAYGFDLFGLIESGEAIDGSI